MTKELLLKLMDEDWFVVLFGRKVLLGESFYTDYIGN